jgi:crotonobetainyl-CoA:carnitine CoA-transferase CaiB-like acyl-CoA transferase
MDAIGAVQAGKILEFHLEGEHGQPGGVPVATYAAADGYITINARRDPHFVALCQILGLPELARDARFATADARLAHEAELMPMLRERVKLRPMSDLQSALTVGDVLHAPVNDYRRYLDDDHVTVTGAVIWVDHPVVGRIPLHRIPGLDPPTSGSPAAHSPAVGEHTRAVLEEIGLTPGAIAALEAAGVARAAAL